jgi:hypothetical protein
LVVLALTPDLIRFLPWELRPGLVEALALVGIACFGLTKGLSAAEVEVPRIARWARQASRRLDLISDWALRRGLVLALGLFCAGLWLAWLPHYLVWPWSRDQETFAVLAQSWDQGILPYRDIRAYNFPGATYLAWALGKLFGWGHGVPHYLFDAVCLFSLGMVLIAWSRRRLGGAIPGFVGYLTFLMFYMSLTHEYVAERDWYTALLVCLGLLVMQAWPGPHSRLASAFLAALALSIRPHAVLFLPAMVYEVARGAAPSVYRRDSKARAVAQWCVRFGVFTAMMFAPLVWAGIADDFLGGLRVAAYGGPYSNTTPARAIQVFTEQFTLWRTTIPLTVTLLTAVRPNCDESGIARTWSLAWLSALLYRPLHPVHHFYLIIPILLIGSITWPFVLSWLLSVRRLARPLLVVATALVSYEILPKYPTMCSFADSIRSLHPLITGEPPAKTPRGCERIFPVGFDTHDAWREYCELLNYLRSETTPKTLVANVLNRFPYEPLNAPTGRLSPFRAESGICWMTGVDMDLDSEFATSLAESPDSVVVWIPEQAPVDYRIRLPRLIEVVQLHYKPAARFGHLEVWKRITPASP